MLVPRDAQTLTDNRAAYIPNKLVTKVSKPRRDLRDSVAIQESTTWIQSDLLPLTSLHDVGS
jgi:hypothetical protein